MNAKDQLDLLRDNLNEASANVWSDVNLLRRLNIAQRRIAMRVAQTAGHWLTVSASVTPVASVITLPADCSKPLYLEETSSKQPIDWIADGLRVRQLSRGELEAYPLMSTIEVNQDSYTTACTLWYQIRVPDLHCGYAQSGCAASTLEMDDVTVAASGTSLGTGRELAFVNDYYNNVTVEVIDKTSLIVDIRSAVTDYVASTHKMTITGTPEDTDTYGTISRLPEETHQLIILEATVSALMKPEAKFDKAGLEFYMLELKEAREEVRDWLSSRIPGGDYVTPRGDY